MLPVLAEDSYLVDKDNYSGQPFKKHKCPTQRSRPYQKGRNSFTALSLTLVLSKKQLIRASSEHMPLLSN